MKGPTTITIQICGECEYKELYHGSRCCKNPDMIKARFGAGVDVGSFQRVLTFDNKKNDEVPVGCPFV